MCSYCQGKKRTASGQCIYCYGSGHKNITVKNGTVSSWGDGAVDLQGSLASSLVMNILADGNGGTHAIHGGTNSAVIGCTANDNATIGIFCTSCTISNSAAARNGLGGIEISFGTIHGSTASNNGSFGITAQRSTITDSMAYSNDGDGFNVAESTVTSCTSTFNGDDGIRAFGGNRIEGNTTNFNTGDGIEVSVRANVVVGNQCDSNGNDGDGAGIHVILDGTGNVIDGNNVSNNDRGIDVNFDSNSIVRNTARDNTTNYTIIGGNQVGTIVTTPVGAGAWDNFDF